MLEWVSERQKGVLKSMELEKRKPTGRPGISDVKKELVLRLYAEDKMTVPQIAEVCGISSSSVFRIVRERRAAYEQAKEKS